ncbi:hypothetical protein BK703_00620 [Bacillus thuringiensis serovar silo]|uniref:hypothetical protein n=1 Tax=Bacillus thuringiensis TaxID=1428 RepID=UPI000A3B1C6D|nr:hypothetical protein [Bacillus thuringiensis]MED3275799.1 hypothetical protein [Bacillus thuringiensis]OTW63422.1 hypothetical protein BK703_00620 [Bacillus thuringiensis serovar silo]OTW73724.1 hypothetical protein BK700_02195 [Bacillus thuringiensis serovar toguchini]
MEIKMPNLINEPNRIDFVIESGENISNYLMFHVGGEPNHIVNLSFGMEITEGILGSELIFTSVHVNPDSMNTQKILISKFPFHINWLGYIKIKKLYVSASGPLKGWYALLPISYPTHNQNSN